MNCKNWYINPATNFAVVPSPLKCLNEQIAKLTKEVSQKEIELLAAKNLLHSLKKQSIELQKCQFIAEGRVKHIVRGHVKEVVPGSHAISKTKKDTPTYLIKYLESLTAKEREKMLEDMLNSNKPL